MLAEATQQYGHTRRLLLRMASSELARWIGEYKILQEATAQLRASKSRAALTGAGGLSTPGAILLAAAANGQQPIAASSSSAGTSLLGITSSASSTAVSSMKVRKNSTDSLPPMDHQSDSDDDDPADPSAHELKKSAKNALGTEANDPLDADKIRLEHEISVCFALINFHSLSRALLTV